MKKQCYCEELDWYVQCDVCKGTEDIINKPSHYNSGTIETIDYITDVLSAEMLEGFCIGNVLKYVSRYNYKNGVTDLKKAQYYLNKAIKIMEEAR